MTYEEAMQREMLAAGDKTMKRRHRSFEENMQQDCVAWFDRHFPRLRQLLHHSPNGGVRTQKEGAKFKRMGTRAGFPDLIWLAYHWNDNSFVPFTGIEFKYDKGRQEASQIEYEQLFKGISAEYYIIKDRLKFKRLIVTLIDKAVMSSSVVLTKEEEQSLAEARAEIRMEATSEEVIAKALAKAHKKKTDGRVHNT